LETSISAFVIIRREAEIGRRLKAAFNLTHPYKIKLGGSDPARPRQSLATCTLPGDHRSK